MTHDVIITSALLLAFENGTQVPPVPGVTQHCNSIATESLASVLSTITSSVELFTLGTQSVDFDLLPPFVVFAVYKAAAILTKSLVVYAIAAGNGTGNGTGTGGGAGNSGEESNESLRKLRVLRKFLGIAATRWLGCGKFNMIP
jgi:hypothetical protein